MTKRTRTISPSWCLLLVLSAVILLNGNGVIIPDIMESRNLITAREMVNDGHWMIPTMNGELRIEKPPLPTWIAAWTMMTLGDSWQVLRLVPALAGMLLLFYFYRLVSFMSQELGVEDFGRCSNKEKGVQAEAGRSGSDVFTLPLVCCLVLLTCYNFVLAAKTVTWDICCHAFQLGGVYHLYLMVREPRNGWRNALLAGLMTGLSIMSKGPVSPYALLLPFLLAWGLFNIPLSDKIRLVTNPSLATNSTPAPDSHSATCPLSSAKGMWLKILAVVVTALVIGGWWYVYVYQSQAHSSMSVLEKETTAWAHRNVRPWYYYWSFFTETAIWIPLCLAALVAPLWSRAVREELSLKRLWQMGLVWTLATLLLLSLMPEKKNRYLLPILIPASLMMGCVLWQLIREGRRWAKRVLIVVVTLFVLLAVVGMPLLRGVLVNDRYETPSHPELPTYWAQGEELRPELVYDAGCIVREVDVTDSIAIAALPRPCRLMVSSELDADSLYLGNIRGLDPIGNYDCNRHAAILKQHKQHFIFDLYLLK